jgi:uncharacterized protein with HEPN domain
MAASKSPRLRLMHIRQEIEAITSHFSDIGFADFVVDYLKIRATERALLIISEAAKALPDELIAQQSSIDWRAIRSIGNRLRHEYERINPATLWSIVHDHLPNLELAVIELLEKET